MRFYSILALSLMLTTIAACGGGAIGESSSTSSIHSPQLPGNPQGPTDNGTPDDPGVPTAATIFSIDVTSAAGHATYTATFDDAIANAAEDSVEWTLPSSIALVDSQNGHTIATLEQAHSEFADGASVNRRLRMDYRLLAGADAITVTVNSASMTFAALSNPGARAMGAAGVTDTALDGAALQGVGTQVFLARYNETAHFAPLMGGISISSGGSASSSTSVPSSPGAFDTIAATVSEINLTGAFTLTANDRSTGSVEMTLDTLP